MAVASPPRAARIPSRKARARRARPTRLRRLVRLGQRAFLVLMALPLALRVVVIAIVLLALWSVVNWTYQVIRKPTELFFPVSGRLFKTPPETWRSYEVLFRAHSTAIMAPELLAALAQVEGAGNPVARTYWRWRLSWNPFEWYQPASSAVGMYQITTPTFREARRYCIHYHAVAEEGPWHEWHSCWFNVLYTRVLPSHHGDAPAEAGPGRDHSPLRRRRGRCLRAARLPADPWPEVRRPRRPRLPGADQHDEAAVHPPRGHRIAVTTGAAAATARLPPRQPRIAAA